MANPRSCGISKNCAAILSLLAKIFLNFQLISISANLRAHKEQKRCLNAN